MRTGCGGSVAGNARLPPIAHRLSHLAGLAISPRHRQPETVITSRVRTTRRSRSDLRPDRCPDYQVEMTRVPRVLLPLLIRKHPHRSSPIGRRGAIRGSRPGPRGHNARGPGPGACGARLVGGLINAVDFENAAVTARAVGVRGSRRAGRFRPASKADRSLADVWRLPGTFPRPDRTLSCSPSTRPPPRPDGPRAPLRSDRPRSKFLSVYQ